MTDEFQMAFCTANKTKINETVQAAMKVLGLSQGSISAMANPYAAYDLYQLLQVYMTDPERRLEIHKIIGVS